MHLPALRPTGDGSGAARRRSRDRFAELALPRVGTALADEPVTALALRQHSARAAMQAVHELLRGRVPLPVHIRVAAGAGGQARACIAEADDGDDGNADWGPVGAQFAAPAAAMH